jgi:type II secretory pathway component GspD/PulD (secretin)
LQVAVLNSNDVGLITDVFKAVSTVGDTTRVAKFPVVTLNNRPVSRRIGRDIGYLASSTTTASTTTGVAPTVALSPGTIHEGFSVQMTPRLLDDGRILLQYSLSIVNFVSLQCFSSQGFDCSDSTSVASAASSGSAIQVPTTANRIFVQQSVLKSGSTLLIGGVDQDDTSQNSQGVGDPFNYLLGGGTASSKTHTMVFYAITPQVLESPRAEPR